MVKEAKVLDNPMDSSSVNCYCPYCAYITRIYIFPRSIKTIILRMLKVTLFNIHIFWNCINCKEGFVWKIPIHTVKYWLEVLEDE